MGIHHLLLRMAASQMTELYRKKETKQKHMHETGINRSYLTGDVARVILIQSPMQILRSF